MSLTSRRGTAMVMTAILVATGCNLPVDLEPSNCAFMDGWCTSAPVGIVLDPISTYILTGDAIVVTALSNAGPTMSTWKVSGVALFVVADTLATTPPASALVKIRAIRAGTTTVEATTVTGGFSSAATYAVADSSAIVAINFDEGFGSVKLPPAMKTWTNCTLRDAELHYYLAKPTSFTSSDSSVAMISLDAEHAGCAGIIRTFKAGEAMLTAHFLGLSTTMRVTVSP